MDLEHRSPTTAAPAHGHALRLMARGALLGARGNSGVILSQILRGLADALRRRTGRRAAGRWPTRCAGAAAAAYAAVAQPVEGTAAHRGRRRGATPPSGRQPTTCAVVARAAATGAAEALARTPEQLPALARAGVVDAGGRGLVRAARRAGRGGHRGDARRGRRPRRPRPAPPATAVRETGSAGVRLRGAVPARRAEPRRSTRLRGDAGRARRLAGGRRRRRRPGVATWNVHVHVNDVGAAIEAGVAAGRPYRISVTRFADQVAPAPPAPVGAGSGRPGRPWWSPPAPGSPSSSPPRAPPWCRRQPVHRRAAGRRSGPPAPPGSWCCPTTPTRQAVAERRRRGGAAGRRQGQRGADPLAGAGARRARRPRPGPALRRRRDRDGRGGRRLPLRRGLPRQPGGADRRRPVPARRRAGAGRGRGAPDRRRPGRRPATALLDRMLGGGGELVTLLVGRGRPGRAGRRLSASTWRERWPFVEVQAYEGGQPHYPLLVGVE